MTQTFARPYLAETHVVENQPPPLRDYNTYQQDSALVEALAREGAAWAEPELRSFGALNDVELHVLALFQGLESIALQRGIMHEDIVSAIEPDKTEPLTIVEPFHCPLGLHTVLPFSTHRHNERISSPAESHGMVMMTIKGEIKPTSVKALARR